MNTLIRIEDWRQYLKEGDDYLRAAENGGRKRPEVFTPEILYNLMAMAIEKHIMGYLMFHGDLAENHTMADLVTALERHAGPQPSLREELLFLDAFQSLCDLDTFSHRPPERRELGRILATARRLRDFVQNAITESDSR